MSEKQNRRRRVAQKSYLDKLHADQQTMRAEVAASREQIARLLRALEGVALVDKTDEYWAGERTPPPSDLNPEPDRSYRWRTPRALATEALSIYPATTLVGPSKSSLARQRLVLFCMQVYESHEAQGAGCQCVVCQIVPVAVGATATDKEVAEVAWCEIPK